MTAAKISTTTSLEQVAAAEAAWMKSAEVLASASNHPVTLQITPNNITTWHAVNDSAHLRAALKRHVQATVGAIQTLSAAVKSVASFNSPVEAFLSCCGEPGENSHLVWYTPWGRKRGIGAVDINGGTGSVAGDFAALIAADAIAQGIRRKANGGTALWHVILDEPSKSGLPAAERISVDILAEGSEDAVRQVIAHERAIDAFIGRPYAPRQLIEVRFIGVDPAAMAAKLGPENLAP